MSNVSRQFQILYWVSKLNICCKIVDTQYNSIEQNIVYFVVIIFLMCTVGYNLIRVLLSPWGSIRIVCKFVLNLFKNRLPGIFRFKKSDCASIQIMVYVYYTFDSAENQRSIKIYIVYIYIKKENNKISLLIAGPVF